MSRKKDRGFIKRRAIDVAGFGLIFISPFLGWLPGPGGIPIFVAGLALLALNYDWADNLLKDFDKKRLAFVEKYLVGNKRISRTIDVLCLLIIVMAIVAVLYLENSILRLLSAGAGTFSFFILISNQKRLDTWFARLKNRKH